MTGTTLTSTTAQVNLASYATGGPFKILAGTSIVAAGGFGIYGDDTDTWVLSNAGLVEGASGASGSGASGNIGVFLTFGIVTNSATIAGGQGGSGDPGAGDGGAGAGAVYFETGTLTNLSGGQITGGNGGRYGLISGGIGNGGAAGV